MIYIYTREVLVTCQGRSKPLKTGGAQVTAKGASLLRGSGSMLPWKILKISLSENIFPGF